MAIQKIVLISALACALTFSTSHGADPKTAVDAKDACKAGRAQYAAGDAVKAAKTLARCVEHDPKNREAWVSLANAELENGRFDQSADAFAKAHGLKAGDDAFLAGYLSALEGAGRGEERIPVLKAIASRKPSDRKRAAALLAAVEASGSDKHAEEYLWSLQVLGEGPGAERYHLEKLAAAYLRRGVLDKAEAEYRGLLVKSPESAEDWAGLGAALAASDAQAAAECYGKAAFYSNQASQRSAYAAEQQRLSKSSAAPAKAAPAEDPKDAVLAVVAAPTVAKPAAPAPVSAAPSAPAATTAKADPAKEKEARDIEARAKAEADRKAKEEKARQDELARKQAEAEKERIAKEEKAKQEQKAKEEKAKQDEIARKQAEAEKERIAKEEKAKQEQKAREEKAKQESVARAEKARQDSLAKLAEQKSKAAPVAAAKPAAKPFDLKAFQDSIYKVELEKRMAALNLPKTAPASPPTVAVPSAPSMAPAKTDPAKEKEAREAEAKAKAENERMAKEEKQRQDELARKQAEAEKERLAKDEKSRQEQQAKEAKAKQEALAKAEKSKQDSLARVAEVKAKEEKAKQEGIARAEKAKQDSLARLAEAKVKAEKAMKDSLARVAEQKAKEEKARQEALAKAEKARQDSLARVAEQKAKEEKARLEAIARAEKAKQDSLARVAEAKAKAEKALKDSLSRVAELKAKEEKARQERERLARERKDRFDRAYALYRDGRMDTAAIVFKTVLADSPIADAWYYAGRVHLAKGDHPRAFEFFGKSPADKPDLEWLKGKALMGMGKTKEAQKALESQYAKNKDDSLLPDIVALKRKNGDAAGAIATLEVLAEKRPGVIKYQEELATWWRGKGDNAKASDRYSRVFILDPLHGEANYWLGMEASKTTEQMRAVSMLERAVVAFPTRAEAWKALAKANLALGRKDAAWETHRKAFALLPRDLELAKGRLALARESHPAELAAAHEDVLRLAPGDADAAMGLARIRFQQGDWAAAEKHFRIACKDSKDSRAWAEYGRSLLELKRTDEAATALQKAVDLGDKDQGLRLDLARIRMDKGDLDWAEALVKDLAKKSPADAEPQYWLGQIALKRQQTAVAEEFFRKAHQLRPEEGRYSEALARQLRDKDEWKAAVAVLTQSEGKLTLSGKLLYGDCLAHAGEQAKALEVYGALYQQQASAALLSRRMDLFVRMGKAGQAVEAAGGSPFQEAVEVKYSLAKAQLALAESHVLKGDVDQAVDLMKSVLKSDDHKPEYHYHLGLAYALQNKPKKALSAFTDALTYRVEYPEALYRKGLSLLALEEVKDAENAFGELSQHADPLWKARGLYGLAQVFGAQGKPEAVQHHLERSITAAPTADAMAHLSRLLVAQGKAPEAQDWARKALTLDPGHEAATVALADALAAGKKQGEAMELARQGLKVKPLSCGLLVQSAKLNYQAGKLDSTLAASNVAIKACPDDAMAYFYGGIAMHSSNRPKEAKQFFKAYRKLGGDEKLVPAK